MRRAILILLAVGMLCILAGAYGESIRPPSCWRCGASMSPLKRHPDVFKCDRPDCPGMIDTLHWSN